MLDGVFTFRERAIGDWLAGGVGPAPGTVGGAWPYPQQCLGYLGHNYILSSCAEVKPARETEIR